MEIVQIAHSFPPYIGGLSHVVENLSHHLVEDGHDLEVVTLDPSWSLDLIDSYDGVSVRRFPCIAPEETYFLPHPQVIGYIRGLDADIFHVHNIAALLVPAAWMALRDREVPVVLSPHHHVSGSTWHTKMLWNLYGPVAGRIVRWADVVHSVSEGESRSIKNDFGVEPVVVRNGVAEECFDHTWSPPEEELVVTYSGRVEEYKRVDRIVEACRILKGKGREVTLRIIGEGSYLPKLLEKCREAGVDVEHFHFLPRDEYLEKLCASTCFVNASKYEAFSIVTAEALAMGVPAVASLPWGRNFEGSSKLVLVDGDSPESVADGIEKAQKFNGLASYNVEPWGGVAEKILKEIYRPLVEG